LLDHLEIENAFLLGGCMCCGVLKDDLIIRTSSERYEKALAQPHARPMNFTGRPLRGFVFVSPAGFRTDTALRKWVEQAAEFALSLPPKGALS
jgi:hypothetical protein